MDSPGAAAPAVIPVAGAAALVAGGEAAAAAAAAAATERRPLDRTDGKCNRGVVASPVYGAVAMSDATATKASSFSSAVTVAAIDRGQLPTE